MAKKPRIKDLMQSDNPLGHSTATAMETHANKIWRTTDRARQYVSVWNRIRGGMNISQACEECGIVLGTYNMHMSRSPFLMQKHKEAISAAAIGMIDPLLDLAYGRAKETRTTTDSEGNVITVVTQCAPDIKAIKYALNNLQPQHWSEKVDVQHSGEIKYEPLAITVKPVTIDVEATDAEVTEKKGTVVDL